MNRLSQCSDSSDERARDGDPFLDSMLTGNKDCLWIGYHSAQKV